MSDGFTLIEIVMVVALFLLISVVSVMFAVPAISQFSCAREVSTVKLALERARHVSQFLKKGTVTFEITQNAYKISAPGHSGSTSFNEEIERQGNILVAVSGNGAGAEIVFQENSGALVLGEGQESVEVVVGGNDAGCREQIHISYVGTML